QAGGGAPRPQVELGTAVRPGQQLELQADPAHAPAPSDPSPDAPAGAHPGPAGRAVEAEPAPLYDQVGAVPRPIPVGQGLDRAGRLQLHDPPHDEDPAGLDPDRLPRTPGRARAVRPGRARRRRLGDVARQLVHGAFGHDSIMLLRFCGCTPTSSGSSPPPPTSASRSTFEPSPKARRRPPTPPERSVWT